MANLQVKDSAGAVKYIGKTGAGTDADPFVERSISKLIFSTNVILANGVTYSSGVKPLLGFTQVQTDVLSDKNGTIVINFHENEAGTNILRTLTIPYTGGSGYKLFSAPAFTPYVEYKFTCDEVGQSNFYFDTKVMSSSLSGQILGVDDFISPSMSATLSRNVIVGKDAFSGDFKNVTTTTTTNDHGDHINLNVVSGARPSQLAGRVKVNEVIDTSVSVLQRTITASKIFFVTDIILTIDNTDATSTGRVLLRDGLNVLGTTVLPLLIREAPTNESAVQVVQHQFSEPIEFSTGLFIEEGTGINEVTGVIIGYEE